jgi:hypothetical protein
MSDVRQKAIALAAIKQYEEEEDTTASTLTVMQRLAFEAGAKWADEHQDDGEMRDMEKQRMKLCAMIREARRLEIVKEMLKEMMNEVDAVEVSVNKRAALLANVGASFKHGAQEELIKEKDKIYARYIKFANELMGALDKAKKEDEKDE